jgi:hypothetical protein
MNAGSQAAGRAAGTRCRTQGAASRGYSHRLEARPVGRDLRHLINVIHDLSTRNIGFKVLTGHGASIDTTTPRASWCSALIFRFRPPDCRKRTRLRRVDNRWNSWNLAGTAFLIATCLHGSVANKFKADCGYRKFQQPKSSLKCDKLRMQSAVSEIE